MVGIKITPVREGDLEALDRALQTLSEVLGDTHRADLPSLERALFAAHPAIHAMLAREGNTLLGAAVFSPVFSTVLGVSGLYVSDLWVDAGARGAGLGQRLLAAAATHADSLWQARYLKLAVYHTSPRARGFYERLGFSAQGNETTMILNESGFLALKGTR